MAQTEAWFFEHLIDTVGEIANPGDLRQLHREHPLRYPFLLQSTTPGGELGRFDILFAFPGEALELDRSRQFLVGWFIYLGYELAGEIEPALKLQRDTVLPTAFRDGSLDLNILIRTMVKQGNSLNFCAVSGIVADAEPYAELQETRVKAKGVPRAPGQ